MSPRCTKLITKSPTAFECQNVATINHLTQKFMLLLCRTQLQFQKLLRFSVSTYRYLNLPLGAEYIQTSRLTVAEFDHDSQCSACKARPSRKFDLPRGKKTIHGSERKSRPYNIRYFCLEKISCRSDAQNLEPLLNVNM